MLELRFVALEDAKLWDGNMKLHDIGALIASIRRYGFIDPPKFDTALGAIVYGNGRLEALFFMHKAGDAPPRGIVVKDGDWLVPVIFGEDLANKREAVAFALDHNNLTLAGGEIMPLDMARVWDSESYLSLLQGLATDNALPVTVDGDDLDGLLANLAKQIDQDQSPESPSHLDSTGRIHTCPECGYEFEE